MDYPKFPVTIDYVKPFPDGQREISLNGATTSIPTYSGGFYVAKMAYVNIVATGSTYETSLSNLLTIATSSSTQNPGY